MPFQALGLHEKVVSGILATGYTAPTEIQSLAIPLALEGRDIIGIAQTGTGKTAAFILPILNRLVASGRKAHTKHRPRALILTPTRELAIQADEFARDYGRFTDLRSLTVYGGVDIKKQIKVLKKGVDLIAATPGRLIDHIKQKNVDFSGIEVLVIDEADRMFDMGFIDDVMRIIRLLPLERQTFLFSATFSEEVQLLTEGIQQNPKIITVGRQQTPVESVTQHVFPVQQDRKLDLLLHILNEEKRFEVENQYLRSVRREGNIPAKKLLFDTFDVVDRKWRGIGTIPNSGYKLKDIYAQYDAEKIFDVGTIEQTESPLCIAGEVLQGLKKPTECAAFGTLCKPETPLGALMVSTEGSCAAYYHYKSREL